MDTNPLNLPWVISKSLLDILQDAVKECTGGCIITFKSPNYSAESGGYHPVEIMVNDRGQIQYITDFAFVGLPPYVELAKEIDFDFSCGLFQHMDQEYPIQEGRDLYTIWENNFCAYYKMGVYQITIEEL